MFDKENLEKFLNLSDSEIKNRINSAAHAGSISPERLKNVLADTDKVRNIISKMTPSDVDRLIKIIGKEKAEEMAEKLKENL